MTNQQYRNLRNYLQSIAIFVNTYSPEYANINKRIAICHAKTNKY